MLTKVVIEPSLFELINRAPPGGLHEALQLYPNQKGAGNVIALNAGKPTLAAFQACQLFFLAMPWLDLPAKTAHLLCRRRVNDLNFYV